MALTTLLLAEAVLGLLAGFFGILAARASRGGTLASAVTFIVIGQILMSVGHLVLAFDLLLDTRLFWTLFGNPLGDVVFRIAVVASLGSSMAGFYKLWKLTKPAA